MKPIALAVALALIAAPLLSAPPALAAPAAKAATPASPAWVAHHENRPLITAEQVEAAGGELLLPADAILTPLAADRARELGVRLRRLPG